MLHVASVGRRAGFWHMFHLFSCFMYASAAVFIGKKEIKKVVISEGALATFSSARIVQQSKAFTTMKA